ncbi:MAG: dTDP-glucose 4,6-dehydratase [Pyrobaculum sp.]
MKILVTGGLGFIGSNFIRHILTKYDDVYVVNLDSLSTGANPANLRDFERDKRYRFIKGDIADRTLVRSLLREVDIVVNFAAETHVDRSIADPWPFVHSNTIGAITLFDEARRERRRVIHISTDEVYGEIREGSYTEGDRLWPSSPYSASKAAADLFALAFYKTYGLDVVIVRPTNNFGPYQYPEKLIPKTVIRALLNLKIPIYGTGHNVRDWLYVKDFCEAVEILMWKGRPGEVYNISAGNEVKNIDLVKKILSILGKSEDLIMFVEDRPGHDFRYSLDSTKFRNEFGWRPRHSFEEALKATVEWYVENEWWWRPLATEKVLHPTPWRL